MIGIGIDLGNLNVDYVTNIDRQPRLSGSFRAYTGSLDAKKSMDTGEIVRHTLHKPFEANIGITAIEDSLVHSNVISLARFYDGPRQGKDYRRLSEYIQCLIFYAIGKSLQRLENQQGFDLTSSQSQPITLVLAIPETQYSDTLVNDFQQLLGKHLVEVEDRVARPCHIETLAVRSQLYAGMFSQYMGINEQGAIKKRQPEWEQHIGGVIDAGSHNFQAGIFIPKIGTTGNFEISGGSYLCTEDGMFSVLEGLRDRIKAKYQVYGNINDSQLFTILETGSLDGVSFDLIRSEIIKEKANHLIGQVRQVLGSGQYCRHIALIGRGQLAFEQDFKLGFQDAVDQGLVDVRIAADDVGYPNPGTAVADGVFKLSYVMRHQASKDEG